MGRDSHREFYLDGGLIEAALPDWGVMGKFQSVWVAETGLVVVE